MPPQRRLVDDLATELSTSRTFDPELAAALFELLVPIELKSRLFDPEGTILVLDSTTARYPWELLQDGAAKGALPFAHRGSIVRLTVSDRLTPHQGLLAEARHHALVIGNPVDESFPPLPGARREAENVARALQRAGFEVTLQVEGRPLDAITALFSQRHRILHLAGHGVYEYELRDKTHVTGFVLGDGIFLTGAEVTAMRVAPEIVFLNAAYLGRHSMARSVDNPTGTDARPPASVRFAASLPDQLMTIGCRAVIAPADTVDDMAALTFATAFYEAMFTGHILGQAILSARRKTFEEHGHTNAWGTYLCYGDPDYRLADGNHAEAVAHLEDGSE
jgi:CHAT domain-containing protein